MNPRIQELAHQAERLAEDELAHLERVHNRLYSFTEGREIYNQKFAALIVRECLEVIKWTPSQFPNDEYVKNITEHFGVKE